MPASERSRKSDEVPFFLLFSREGLQMKPLPPIAFLLYHVSRVRHASQAKRRVFVLAATLAVSLTLPSLVHATAVGLYFGNYQQGTLLKADPFTGGAGVAVSSGMTNPQNPVVGPDGNFYLPDAGDGVIYKIDGNTFARTTFIGAGPTTVTGFGVFDGSGNYFVTSFLGNIVRKYDSSGATTGIDLAVNNASGVTLGPDGNIYAASYSDGAIYRFNPTTGAQIGGAFASLGGNVGPLLFGPDGNIYVDNYSTNNVSKVNGTTGAVINSTFLTGFGGSPRGLAFGPDGNLYVGDDSAIQRFNISTGAFIDTFATSTTNPGFVQGMVFVLPVPEPASMLLFGFGAIGLFAVGRRRRFAITARSLPNEGA